MKRLDQSALLQRRLDEAGEKRVRLERTTLQLGVKLDADEPRMVGPLDNFGELVVRRHAGEQQAGTFQRAAIMDVDLVPMAVALADEVLTVKRPDHAVA